MDSGREMRWKKVATIEVYGIILSYVLAISMEMTIKYEQLKVS